jgi:tetratricopeptide (TPR) repeat protein
MSKGLSLLIFCLALQLNASAQSPAAMTLADEALAKARSGQNSEALSLYRKALAVDPDNVAIFRDYAVVLGWGEQYADAITVIKKLRKMQNDQPVWALQEFARSYLFGNATADALSTLDELIRKGDKSETTLTRRALALRWLGRRKEAQDAYRDELALYPQSANAVVGIAYTFADENKHAEALRFLDSESGVPADNVQVMKAKIRILNWMGRHYEAQAMLSKIPASFADDRDILEDRISAARWGGKPVEAAQYLNTLSSLFPSDSSSRLRKDFRTEFGHSFSPSVRYIDDTDGLIDRTAGGDASFHLNPSHVVRLGYQYRFLKQLQEEHSWVRYDLGWTGTLSRRVTVYTTASNVDYRTSGLDRLTVGDGSIIVSASDKFKISGGGGSIMMDAFNSIQQQVTAPFGFGDVTFSPNSATRVQARYSRFAFSDQVNRDRADFEAMRSVVSESLVRFNLGWRSNLMWHDAYTPDFWSPSQFQSHAAVVQGNGRVSTWLDYFGEVSGGWQAERGAPGSHPLQVAARLVWHPSRHWNAVAEAGRSTSSLDRPSSGSRIYIRRVFSAGIQFRFP